MELAGSKQTDTSSPETKLDSGTPSHRWWQTLNRLQFRKQTDKITGEDCSTAWRRSKGGMAAHQGVGAVGMSRELSGTSSRALGPLSALEAGKLLQGLSSHGPGDVSVLMPVLAGEAGQLSSTKGYEDIQHVWTRRGLDVNVRCPSATVLQHQLTASQMSFSFSSDFSRQPEETIHPGHFFVLFTWSGPAVRNCLWRYKSRTLGLLALTWSFLSLLRESHH